jgi:putative ABC transport system permease protein
MFKLLRRIKHARRLDESLRDELEAHRALRQQELERGGMPPEQAARVSQRALGNPTLAREDARAIWIPLWFDAAIQDARYALRAIRRNPGFGAAMILVMGLGIGATTSVFSLIDGLLLKSLPVRNPERLVWFRSPAFSYPIFDEVRARTTSIFSGFFAWNMERLHVQWTTELEPTEVLMATGDFYRTLGVSAIAGRTFGADDDRRGGGSDGAVAVISYACWQRRYSSDPLAIGKTVRIHDVPFTIVGVAPPGFFGVAPGLAPEITVPLAAAADVQALQQTTSSWLHLMGQLREGVTIDRGNQALQTIWPAVLEATTEPKASDRAKFLGRQTALEPGHAGFSRVRRQFEGPLWILMTLVGLLLAVAIASAANLLLARGVARRREIAVRLAIGAGRGRVLRQMLTEAFVWTLLGSAAGLALASWSGRTLVSVMRTTEEPIALDVGVSWRVVLFTLTLTLVTACLCAAVPAWRATRLDAGSTLKDTGHAQGMRRRRFSIDKCLVAAQVAFTLLLLVGGALFVRSLVRVLTQDAGFQRDNLLVIGTDPMAAGYEGARLIAYYDTLVERLRGVPGVESASLSWFPPISDESGYWTQSIAIDGRPALAPDGSRYVYFNAITPRYFRTLRLALLEGRDFAETDNGGAPRVVIVNAALARRFFAGASPIGRRITIGKNKSRADLQIVGVVQDSKYQRLQEETRSIAFLPCAQLAEMMVGANLFAEVRASGATAAVGSSVRREIRTLDPIVPVRIETIGDRIAESLVKERVLALLAVVLSVAALALACAGVYGILAYTVSRHTREIGVRLALGANRGAVLWMVLRDSIVLAMMGSVVGLAAALALGRFVAALLFQITPTDPPSLLLATMVMLMVAGCAGLLPARRAARVDPVVALRSE